MYATSLEEMRRKGTALVPQSLPEALAALEDDRVIQEALGAELAPEFLKVKRQEWVRYHNTVSEWEIDRYLMLF
jgi:glutamine synthetase